MPYKDVLKLRRPEPEGLAFLKKLYPRWPHYGRLRMLMQTLNPANLKDSKEFENLCTDFAKYTEETPPEHDRVAKLKDLSQKKIANLVPLIESKMFHSIEKHAHHRKPAGTHKDLQKGRRLNSLADDPIPRLTEREQQIRHRNHSLLVHNTLLHRKNLTNFPPWRKAKGRKQLQRKLPTESQEIHDRLMGLKFPPASTEPSLPDKESSSATEGGCQSWDSVEKERTKLPRLQPVCAKCMTTKIKMAASAQIPMNSVRLRWCNCSLKPVLSMQDIQACMENYGKVRAVKSLSPTQALVDFTSYCDSSQVVSTQTIAIAGYTVKPSFYHNSQNRKIHHLNCGCWITGS